MASAANGVEEQWQASWIFWLGAAWRIRRGQTNTDCQYLELGYDHLGSELGKLSFLVLEIT